MAVAAPLRLAALALCELFWPERCALCDGDAGASPWVAATPAVRGLRAWDRPHLCAACAGALAAAPRLHRLEGGGPEAPLLVAAGRSEDERLVGLVGQLKYHGVRGLAWPLAGIAAPALALLAPHVGPADVLVPMPLHRDRRRERGFNQAELLARLLGAGCGRTIRADVARRRRATGQQARLPAAGPERAGNVLGAFAAAPAGADAPGAILVDDLATTGHTLAAAAAALQGAGWRVRAAVVVAAASGLGGNRARAGAA